MRFTPAGLQAAFLLDVEASEDERGLFARTYCAREFERHGLPTAFVQSSTSYNTLRGTLRGMHWQAEPRPEGKLVRCTRGAVYDVILDLRHESPGYLQWRAFELTAENRTALYVPPGFAHGFQTLADVSEVLYQMTEFYDPELSRGARWNDPAFRIQWPILPPILSQRDALFGSWDP